MVSIRPVPHHATSGGYPRTFAWRSGARPLAAEIFLDPRVIGLEVDNPGARAAGGAACPIPAGGATVHHSRTLHYTGPNRSDGPRRAYILTFGTPRKPRATPRRFYWLEQQKTKWQERHTAAKASPERSGGA